MKKLNRKGFTLIELLAVIVILAVIVGVTIPIVLTQTQKVDKIAFQTAADTAASWFNSQYQIATYGLDSTGLAELDANFSNACGFDGLTCTTEQTFTNAAYASLIQAAGLRSSNISEMKVKIDKTSGSTCVTLTASTTGDYDKAGTNGGNTITSSSCLTS